MDLPDLSMSSVELIHHEIAVIVMKVVSNDHEGAGVILCQSVKPFKVLYAVFGTIVIFGFSN